MIWSHDAGGAPGTGTRSAPIGHGSRLDGRRPVRVPARGEEWDRHAHGQRRKSALPHASDTAVWIGEAIDEMTPAMPAASWRYPQISDRTDGEIFASAAV